MGKSGTQDCLTVSQWTSRLGPNGCDKARSVSPSIQCPLVAQSGHQDRAAECPLSGVKRTFGEFMSTRPK